MFLAKIVFAVLTFFLFFSTNAQNEALESIDISDLKKHLTIIASDSLMGRQIGADNNGLDMAADYIKSSIEKIGLSPIDGSYFQNVSLYSSKPDVENSYLEVLDKKGRTIIKTDSVICLSGNSDINIENMEVVFLGFGSEDDLTRNVNDIDISGKMVMIMVGDKKSYKKHKPIWNERAEFTKIKLAMENGAAGVILVNAPFDKGDDLFTYVKQRMNREQYSLQEPNQASSVNNSIFIPASMANSILGGEGQLDSRLGKRKIEFKADNNVNINGKILHKEIQAKNVMGVVEGSDPKLKDECVVIMAHYDHLGVNESGDYYNGADDNGSGVVTLIEVAEALVNTPQKPKRSILFLWVTGEEIGLYGSQYYVSNPVFPLEKTVTCINIDMDGRVWEPRDSVWNDSPKKVKDYDGLYTLTNTKWQGLKEINSEKCRELGLVPDYSLPNRFLSSSDHYHFHRKGVPIINFATGYHYDYHKVTDEVSRINFVKIKRVADLCYLVSYEVANLNVIEY